MFTNYTNTNKDYAGIETMTKFSGFFDKQYDDPLINGHAFVFLTKPELFIYPLNDYTSKTTSDSNDTTKMELAFYNMCADPIFAPYIGAQALNPQDTLIAQQLSVFDSYTNPDFKKSNFLPIFTNKSKSFAPTDALLDTTETHETKEGYRFTMPTHTTGSRAGGTVSFSVNETANMDFTKYMTLWVNYIENISNGVFRANPTYVKNGVIDYMSSIYYFTTEPDGKTLKYWTKYTGCYPTTIPFSAFSYQKGSRDVVELDIPFQYMSKEDMNPAILEDFNKVSMDIQDLSDKSASSNNEYSYYNVNNSVYLHPDNIKSSSTYTLSGDRDPLVSYRAPSSDGVLTDSTNAHFELTFGGENNGYSQYSELDSYSGAYSYFGDSGVLSSDLD